MGDAGKFYSYGKYNTNTKIVSLAKKAVYEDEVSIVDNGDGSYTLMIEDTEIGTINTSSTLDIDYDEETHILTISYSSSSGENTKEIDLSDLIDTYKAGKGLKLNSNNKFSVVIDENSDEYLSVSSDGILLTGVKDIEDRVDSIENWADTYILSEDEIDEMILSIEEETNYGMAEAMGVEGSYDSTSD